MEGRAGERRTDELARATGFGADAVLMRCGGGSEREVDAVSSKGLFAGTVGAGVGAGVTMSGVRSAGSGVCENGQKVGLVQSDLRGHASDWNSPCVENMSNKTYASWLSPRMSPITFTSSATAVWQRLKFMK